MRTARQPVSPAVRHLPPKTTFRLVAVVMLTVVGASCSSAGPTAGAPPPTPARMVSPSVTAARTGTVPAPAPNSSHTARRPSTPFALHPTCHVLNPEGISPRTTTLASVAAICQRVASLVHLLPLPTHTRAVGTTGDPTLASSDLVNLLCSPLVVSTAFGIAPGRSRPAVLNQAVPRAFAGQNLPGQTEEAVPTTTGELQAVRFFLTHAPSGWKATEEGLSYDARSVVYVTVQYQKGSARTPLVDVDLAPGRAGVDIRVDGIALGPQAVCGTGLRPLS